MSLTRLRILHIADLHYGYYPGYSRLEKAKTSEQLKGNIGSEDPKEILLGRISSLSQKHRVDALAFTGDLGLGDKIDTMDGGIEYLSTLSERLKISPDRVVISPGNHDLHREDVSGEEFSTLIKKCTEKGFTVARRENPARIIINGIPIISLNTCLGGTEHAFYDVPEVIWDKVSKLVKELNGELEEALLSSVPEKVKTHLRPSPMDIPAIGQHQCNVAENCLSEMTGNFAVIIGHHSLLPTRMLVLRPYAEVIDAGRFIFDLSSNERRILYLHGHTHCDTALLTRAPDTPDSGLMACIGTTGLHSMPGSTSSISFIDVLTDDKPDFLCAIVYRYQLNGCTFVQDNPFFVWDEGTSSGRSTISLDKLEAGKSFGLEEIEKKLKRGAIDREELAIQLLRHRVTHRIEIQDINKSIEDWRIIRNK